MPLWVLYISLIAFDHTTSESLFNDEPNLRVFANQNDNFFGVSLKEDFDDEPSFYSKLGTHTNSFLKMESCNATYHEDSIFGEIESLLNSKVTIPDSLEAERNAPIEGNHLNNFAGLSETDQKEKYIFGLEKDLHIPVKVQVQEERVGDFKLKDFEGHHERNSSCIFIEDFNLGKDDISRHVKSTEATDKPNDWQSEASSEPDFIKSLALRTDVMNKNIFRALRRECKTLYQTFIIRNGLPNPKRGNKKYLSNLRKFTRHLLSTSELGIVAKEDINIDDFILYVGTLVNYWGMKNSLKDKKQLNKVNTMHQLLYSYSHVKFYTFIKIREVSLILRILWEILNVDDVISHNASLTANKKQYKAHMLAILAHVSNN